MTALWMEDLFANILNQSISASWLILAVILVRVCMKRTPKSLRYVLWALVAVRLLCPVFIESSWSLVPDIEIFSKESADTYFNSAAVEDLEDLDASDKIVEILPEDVVDITDRYANKGDFSMEEVFPLVPWIWLIGMVVIFLCSAISVLRLRNKVRASLQMEANVWVCDEIQSPFIFGVIAPRIYVPSYVTKEQLPFILAHENEHLKYRDHLWKISPVLH